MTKFDCKWKNFGGIIVCLNLLIGPLVPTRLFCSNLGNGTLVSTAMIALERIESPEVFGNTSDDERERERAANHLYRNGIKLYLAGKYWDCAQELIVLLDFYPQFEKIDGVIYYVAESLSEMEMNKPALKMLRYLLKTYPKSEYTSVALLGLQKIYFREKKYEEATHFYFSIIKNNYDAQITDAARYYHGQSNFYMKKWDNAILVLRRISNKSEYYGHALYTTALAMLKKKEFVQLSNILKA